MALTRNNPLCIPHCLLYKLHEAVGSWGERKMTNGQAGKGDKYRKVDSKKYAENWEKIFGKKKKDSENGNRNGTNGRKNRGSSKRT